MAKKSASAIGRDRYIRDMVLYHGSTNKDLSVLKPQRTLSNNHYIGDFVFATKSRLLAIMYLVPHGIPILMNPDPNDPDIVICSNADNFRGKDSGGAVYELSGENFQLSPQQDLSDYEMVSSKEVTPISKTIYDSSLDAMLQHNIKVRFTDELTFKNLINNPKQKELINHMDIFTK